MITHPLKPIAGAFGSPKQETVTQDVQQSDPAPAPVPKEAPDTLFSHSYARVIDALCEGEIAGLCDHNGRIITNANYYGRAVYLNGTPLMGIDSTSNFKGVALGINFGTQDQTYMLGFGQPSDVQYIGVQFTHSTPASVAVTNPDTDVCDVSIRIPTLVSQDKKTGDISGAEVDYVIQVSLNGGPFVQKEAVVVKGKCSSAYTRTTSIQLPHSSDPEADNWVIKVVRTTPDSTTAYLQNDTYLDFITTRARNSFRYPNTAIMAAEVDAKEFSTIPTRSFRIKGLIVQVPSNYFPATRLYNRNTDGSEHMDEHGAPVENAWDGTFYPAWTDNPAWCFYDLVTNKRYGLGNYISEDQIDKWSLYPIAKYCDELVDDGFGGKEPRFACTVYIQSREEAWKVVNDFASVFRGMPYWEGGAIRVTQDAPRDPICTFTCANVEQGIFQYSGTAKKARHTVCAVRYNDPTDLYKPKFEYVEDSLGILKYGLREEQIAAFACTSRGQAHRLGKFTLLSELHLTQTVTFKTGREGAYVRPGDVFTVMDNYRAGESHGGRLLNVSGDLTSVRLDRAIFIPAGETTVTIGRPAAMADPNGLTSSTQIPLVRTAQIFKAAITNSASPSSDGATNPATASKGRTLVTTQTDLTGVQRGDVMAFGQELYEIQGIVKIGAVWNVTLAMPWKSASNNALAFQVRTPRLTFAEAIDANVTAGAVFLVETPSLTSQLFKCVSNAEDNGQYTITGLQYDPNKFAAIEGNLSLEAPDITDLPQAPTTVTPINTLVLSKGTIVTQDGVRLRILIGWNQPADPYITSYLVEYQVDQGNWITIETTRANSSQLIYTSTGTYTIAVTAINILGAKSVRVTQNITIDAINPIALFSVVGLELVGQANDTTFVGRDAKFEWRLSSPNSTVEPGQETGGEQGFTDPYFQTFQVSVFDVETDARVYTENTASPNFAYTFEKNSDSTGGPRFQFRLEVIAIDKWGNPSDPAKISVSNPPPAAPTNVQVNTAWRFISLSWTNPPDSDFDHADIYQSSTDVIGDAVLVASVKANAFTLTGLEPNTTVHLWVKAVDTFGTSSPAAPEEGLVTTTGTVPHEDIADFGIDASKLFLNVVVLQRDEWMDNAPIAGEIAWNEHDLYFAGVKYTIAAGDTPHQYVWWQGPIYDGTGALVSPGEASYRTQDDHPADTASMTGDNAFIIAVNADNAGTHQVAWRGIANEVIGSAYIKALVASKISSGTISSAEITLDGTGTIKSANYSPGTAGFKINGDGTAEFNSLTVREAIDLESGYFNNDYPTRLFLAQPCVAVYSPDNSVGASTGVVNLPTHTVLADGTIELSQNNGTGLSPNRSVYSGVFKYPELITPDSTIFTGIDVVPFGVTGGAANCLGTEVGGLLYRRLGRDGSNVFKITAGAFAIDQFGVWFCVLDAPTDQGVGFPAWGAANGDAPGSAANHWNFAFGIDDGASTGTRRYIQMTTILRINVPHNKVIVFGVSPAAMNNSGTATVQGSATIDDLSLSVEAMNIGPTSIYTTFVPWPWL